MSSDEAETGQRAELVDKIHRELLDIVVQSGQPSSSLMISTEVARWIITDGFDPDLDILPIIRARSSTMAEPPRSWKYFERPIAEAHARRTAGVSIAGMAATGQLNPPDEPWEWISSGMISAGRLDIAKQINDTMVNQGEDAANTAAIQWNHQTRLNIKKPI